MANETTVGIDGESILTIPMKGFPISTHFETLMSKSSSL